MEAYGDDYPAEADPFGFVTLTELRVLDGILQSQQAPVAELGPNAAGVLIAEATETPAMLASAPRMIVSAVRG
jgi:hypothetical protein